MSHKKMWMKTSEFSARAQFALLRFEQETGMMIYNKEISHFRDDAIFIRHYGTLGIATLTRLANLLPDGILVEIDAVANNYIDIQLFFSDWQAENSIKSSLKCISGEKYSSVLSGSPESVRVKIDPPYNPIEKEQV